MDVFSLLFLICFSVVVGIVLTVIVQYYVLVRYFHKGAVVEEQPRKASTEEFQLPENLKKKLDSDGSDDPGSSLAVSLMLQFLFQELRHSDSIKKWLYKKLSLEFDELLNKTTIGKFFEVVTIKDMHLGTQFPDIKDIKMDSIQLDKSNGYIETLNLTVKLDYTGNFSLSVLAKMKFGKTAYLSIKVQQISGLARIQFTRNPYTHWSFGFCTEPVMDFAVESHFQGRQLQSNITSLIVHQIKKVIKRKHTLPNYKIRYKPFFVKTDPGQLDADETEIVPQGQLEVYCTEVSRLTGTVNITNVHCTFAVDSIPFICVYLKDNVMCVVLELTMTKGRQQQFGVIFKQELNSVVVENVTPSTAAAVAGLRSGDIVLAIDNKNVSNVSQVSRVMKALSNMNISIRIERTTNIYAIKPAKSEEKLSAEVETNVSEQDSFVIVEKLEDVDSKRKGLDKLKSEKVPKLISASNENMSKIAQTLGNFSLRKRKTSAERSSNEGSNKSTPTASCPNTPQHALKQHTISMPILNKKNSLSEVPEIVHTDPENQLYDAHVIDVQRGKEALVSSIISFHDEFVFNLKENMKYLNVNIWGCASGKDVLLGYANIPLTEVLNACCNSLLGNYTRSYLFLPPNNITPNSQTHPLMSHSGFEHVFCYGDVLLSFVWNNNETMEIRRKSSMISNESEAKPLEKQTANQHDFIRTQFHRSIHCDFCSKKIWLKDAVQCRDCGLCCHKKCISKCQLSTDCLPGDRIKVDIPELSQPEIVMTETNDSFDEDSSLELINSTPIKRVNSVNNLTIPGSHAQASLSRSLPQSPQRTPNRKQSLVLANPFALCPVVLDDIQTQEPAESIGRLLDQISACASDENLMETARESGRQLYASMSEEEKNNKINAMVSELKKLFDVLTTEHSELSKRLNSEHSDVEKARLAFLLGQADTKMHALSVLMLHYCSALQGS